MPTDYKDGSKAKITFKFQSSNEVGAMPTKQIGGYKIYGYTNAFQSSDEVWMVPTWDKSSIAVTGGCFQSSDEVGGHAND